MITQSMEMVAQDPLHAPHSTPADSADEAVIRVNNVSKMYRIYDHPQDRLKQMLAWRWGRNYGREFWALKNVSFQVDRGETVGIIGRNGSGKSTLLQVIAGTLDPTEGSVQIHGRVAALLELGSGFNPEYTGRENVFMNGSILGLSNEELSRRFENIAAFADIGSFIEQPVKFYSSGMMVRLAFAVQMHVDADILIVDEALAVGDVFFQAKCTRALKAYQERGGTLLFVSHDMSAVQNLCDKGLLLEHGKVVVEGSTADAVSKYYHLERHTTTATPDNASIAVSSSATETHRALMAENAVPIRRNNVTGTGDAIVERLFITNEFDEPTSQFMVNQRIRVRMVIRFERDANDVEFGIGLSDRSGQLLGGVHSWYDKTRVGTLNGKAGELWLVDATLKASVEPGEYLVLIGLARNFTPAIWEDIYVILDAHGLHISGQPEFWGKFGFETHILPPRRLEVEGVSEDVDGAGTT